MEKRNLGACDSQILRDGWVLYLSLKNALAEKWVELGEELGRLILA